jgi:hypothetical protein
VPDGLPTHFNMDDDSRSCGSDADFLAPIELRSKGCVGQVTATISSGNALVARVARSTAESATTEVKLALRGTPPANRTDMQKLLLAAHMDKCRERKRRKQTEIRLAEERQQLVPLLQHALR